ncbi:MAG: hypothetical protein CL993_01050 [Euryarchaeota archaeon]|nr:hypothetical protein [Euryarchaeota archaeon]|tara:strand:+ start:986 stop:1474 length:489 start_codon:yes stop_codon:yes gene_type:complete
MFAFLLSTSENYISAVTSEKILLSNLFLKIFSNNNISLIFQIFMAWWFDIGKIFLTALIIFIIVEISEKNTLFAAILASIPIVSVLSMMMMYQEGQDAIEISQFAKDIVYLIIPSLLLFIVMPWLIETHDWAFYPALFIGLLSTIFGYFIMVQILEQFSITT